MHGKIGLFFGGNAVQSFDGATGQLTTSGLSGNTFWIIQGQALQDLQSIRATISGWASTDTVCFSLRETVIPE